MDQITLSEKDKAEDWWRTEIIEMSPGSIHYHGYAVQDLIGQLDFAEMIWLMLSGDRPNQVQKILFNAALMSAVDHGPQAPSIAIARMAMTCGGSLNNAMASAVNVLDDVHGGAGEQAIELYQLIKKRMDQGDDLESATKETLKIWQAERGKIIPGFGHRFHPVDPRTKPLIDLIRKYQNDSCIEGAYINIALEIERQISQQKNKSIPMNIDGATAVYYASLGFAPALARGFFCLSRSVGILSHAWEQQQQNERNKGPLPKGWRWNYKGKEKREFSNNRE